MSPNNTDIPSVIKLPDDINSHGISILVREKLDEGSDVLIIDRRQGSLITYSGDLADQEITSDSLPFLLSNHSVKVLPSSPTIDECLKSILVTEGTVCVFHNPADNVSCSLPTHATKIVNKNALLGLVQQQDKRYLTSITVGQL